MKKLFSNQELVQIYNMNNQNNDKGYIYKALLHRKEPSGLISSNWLNPKDTHQFIDMEDGNISVGIHYIKVLKTSREYKQAVSNSYKYRDIYPNENNVEYIYRTRLKGSDGNLTIYYLQPEKTHSWIDNDEYVVNVNYRKVLKTSNEYKLAVKNSSGSSLHIIRNRD